jgi:Ca-activated chloride channel family protein
MIFIYPYLLFLLVIPILLWFFIKVNKTTVADFFSHEVFEKISDCTPQLPTHIRLKLLVAGIALISIALARPVLEGEKDTIPKQLSQLIVALDISRSMVAEDVYPSRFAFAKNKLTNTLDALTDIQLGVIGFADNSFLISPLTTDTSSLQTLIANVHTEQINLSGTSFLSAMRVAHQLLTTDDNSQDNSQNSVKQVLFITDGGDNQDLSEEIQYAQDNNMQIFIFDISTIQGATLSDNDGVLKDNNGNIVIVKTNPSIQELATQTNGKYMKYSLKTGDLADFITSFKQHTQDVDITITRHKELFYYPLIIAIIILLIAFFSLPELRRVNG